MKRTRITFPVTAALAALFLFGSSAPGQAPMPRQAAKEDGVAVAASEEVHSALSRSVRLPRPISFLPADIFTLSDEFQRVQLDFSASLWVPPPDRDRARQEYDRADLARKLRNPVSALARIYFESNLDFGMAANREGYRYTMNLEPLIPFALNRDWNLISRTRLPIIQQDGIVESEVQTGVGDILQSFYLSPNTAEPVFWGAGTALLIPTATDTKLGTGKFGLGPAVVIGGQQGAWTYGATARQMWSVAGHRDRPDVRSTYLQPFVAYTTRSAWTYAIDTESTYDWVEEQWSVPIHVEVTKVLRFRRLPVAVGAALTCFAVTPPGGPQACGVRFTVTPLFPNR